MPFSSASCVTRSSARHVLAHRADRHRDRRVAVVAVQLHAHVERHDVARHQRRRRRDPVHHLLVHRRAQRRGIAAIALERRLGARRAHLRLRRRVEVRRRHARRHHRRQLLEDPRDQLVRRAHLLELRRRLADDHSRAAPRSPPTLRGSPRPSPPSPRPAAGCRRSSGTSAAPSRTPRSAASAGGRPSTVPPRSRRCRRCGGPARRRTRRTPSSTRSAR